MTSDEIRGYKVDANQVCQAVMLREIAAQLAELNAHLKDDSRAINVALCATNDTIPVMIRER